ncbi:hypothetical protein GCM10008934_02570 [Virgibacillus salarius]
MDRLHDILWGVKGISIKSVGVAQYGIEAAMPKPNVNIKSPKEIDEMDARETRLYNRWKEYKEKVLTIEIMVDYLEDEQHQIILDCMMEGMSYRSIADHLGINRNKIRAMKEDMLCQICQKCHFLLDLLDKNSA